MAKRKVIKKEPLRPLDKYFNKYAQNHQDPRNILLHWIYLPLISFSILGLIWAIPVQFSFLGKYKDYFNLASLLIGALLYYYLRLSPMLFWGALLTVGLFSYFIVQLEYWERAGGPPFWSVCAVLFVIASIGMFIGNRLEGKKNSFFSNLRGIPIGFLWLWSKLFDKFKVSY